MSEVLLKVKRYRSFIYWNVRGVRTTWGTYISTKSHLEKCSFFGNSNVLEEAVVGENTYGTDLFIQHATIGRFCSLGPGCKIGLEEHDIENFSTHPSTYDAPSFVKSHGRAFIEDHVWLGANVIVRQGVRIGEHAVVGAGSVVTKNIPPGEIWGGVPAKFIKKRWQ